MTGYVIIGCLITFAICMIIMAIFTEPWSK